MRYIITTKGDVQILEVLNHNIFFGWDMSSDYDQFRVALNAKGIDAFVDLLIENPDNAFTKFVNG